MYLFKLFVKCHQTGHFSREMPQDQCVAFEGGSPSNEIAETSMVGSLLPPEPPWVPKWDAGIDTDAHGAENAQTFLWVLGFPS